MSKDLKKSLLSGLVWTSGGQFLTVFLNLAINIVLARFLSPDEFGIMGIVLFFVLLGDVLAKGGLSGALLRMKEVSKADYSTVFVFNMLVSLFLYVCIVGSSGFIAQFYDKPILKNLLIVGGLTFVINAFQLINITNLIREFKFKERFIYQFLSTLLAGLLAIAMAYLDFGVWSLVFLQLGTSLFLTLILIFKEGFHGGVIFSKESFKKTYAFGVNTSLAALLDTAFENVYSLVLGRYFSVAQVGFYYQAQKLQKVPNNVLNAFSQRVLFPVLAKKQDDLAEFNNIYKKVITIFTVLVGASGFIIFLYAEPLINLMLGAKWFGSIFYLKLLVIASFFFMQEQFNRVIFKVFDKTRTILILEFIKKAFQLVTIGIGVYYKDLEVLIYGFVITNIFSFFINFQQSRLITKTSAISEILIVFKVFACCVGIVLLHLYVVDFFEKSNVFWLIVLLLLEVLLYFLTLKVLNIFNVKTLFSMLKRR